MGLGFLDPFHGDTTAVRVERAQPLKFAARDGEVGARALDLVDGSQAGTAMDQQRSNIDNGAVGGEAGAERGGLQNGGLDTGADPIFLVERHHRHTIDDLDAGLGLRVVIVVVIDFRTVFVEQFADQIFGDFGVARDRPIDGKADRHDDRGDHHFTRPGDHDTVSVAAGSAGPPPSGDCTASSTAPRARSALTRSANTVRPAASSASSDCSTATRPVSPAANWRWTRAIEVSQDPRLQRGEVTRRECACVFGMLDRCLIDVQDRRQKRAADTPDHVALVPQQARRNSDVGVLIGDLQAEARLRRLIGGERGADIEAIEQRPAAHAVGRQR